MTRDSTHSPVVPLRKPKTIAIEPAFPLPRFSPGESRTTTATARVRDALVLRSVAKNSPTDKPHCDEQRAR